MIDGTSLGAVTPATTTASTSGVGALGPDAFMNLLIAQMRYQDPLAPSDPSAMMQQTSMLAQTEMLLQVAEAQQQLLGLTQASIAGDLVGTEITATRADGSSLVGVVDAVRFTTQGPMLVVADEEIALGATTELRLPGSEP